MMVMQCDMVAIHFMMMNATPMMIVNMKQDMAGSRSMVILVQCRPSQCDLMPSIMVTRSAVMMMMMMMMMICHLDYCSCSNDNVTLRTRMMRCLFPRVKFCNLPTQIASILEHWLLDSMQCGQGSMNNA
jgi:hypothetical protein